MVFFKNKKIILGPFCKRKKRWTRIVKWLFSESSMMKIDCRSPNKVKSAFISVKISIKRVIKMCYIFWNIITKSLITRLKSGFSIKPWSLNLSPNWTNSIFTLVKTNIIILYFHHLIHSVFFLVPPHGLIEDFWDRHLVMRQQCLASPAKMPV